MVQIKFGPNLALVTAHFCKSKLRRHYILLTPSLIRPSYTLRATIFLKDFWPEIFPKMKKFPGKISNWTCKFWKKNGLIAIPRLCLGLPNIQLTGKKKAKTERQTEKKLKREKYFWRLGKRKRKTGIQSLDPWSGKLLRWLLDYATPPY